MAGNSNYEILFYKILVTYKSSSVIMESWWWFLDCDSPKHWSWHYTVVILKINNPQFGKIFFSKSFDVYYVMDLSRLITERAHNSICTHCLDLDLNGLLTRCNFWRIPGMLGNYTIPKWKEFLKSREPILRKSYLST